MFVWDHTASHKVSIAWLRHPCSINRSTEISIDGYPFAAETQSTDDESMSSRVRSSDKLSLMLQVVSLKLHLKLLYCIL